jgi:N6-adenosine-specific RNA methylase IME4
MASNRNPGAGGAGNSEEHIADGILAEISRCPIEDQPRLAVRSMRVADIVVGRRHRTDLGDIGGLAQSISTVGLLHPIVVRADGTLIAGGRRLEAVKKLGWERIPVTIVELAEIVRGGHAENVERKDFTLTEAVAIKRALGPLETAAAKKRQGVRTDKHSGKLPQGLVGKTRDKVAKSTGLGARTLEKAEAVVAAAEADPDTFGKLKDDMDRTGRVDGVFKRLKVMRQADIIRREPPPLPNRGPYRVIVADPPWPYEARQQDSSHRGTLPYPPMSIAQICAMPIASIAHEDCILWLWVTNAHIREAFEVLDAWGFEQKSILTWIKDQMGIGNWLRGKTEHCLLAVRGKPTVSLTNQTTALHASRGAHSEKPAVFFDLVEVLCPAPRYAYLFSRSVRPHWDGHGDEYPGAPSPQALASVVEQLPRVSAEVNAAEQKRGPVGKAPDACSVKSSGSPDDGLDIPACLDRRTQGRGAP